MSRGLAILPGIIFISLLLTYPEQVAAFAGPNLLSPANNSVTEDQTLVWQKPETPINASNPYRVQVDNNSDFSSPEKDTYVNNEDYKPQLTQQIWYWRVYFRDSSASASEWSTTFSFELTTASPPPSQIPSPTASPTNNETTTQEIASPSPTSSANLQSFTVTNVPSNTNATDSFTTSLNLTNFQPDTKYYLKGAFKKADSSNYFGQTFVSGNWVKNSASYSSQSSIQTDSAGNWSGNLLVMPDNSDSGYSGSGTYIFKVARYDSSGNGPSWSDEFSIQISGDVAIGSATQSNPSTTPKPSVSASVTKLSPSPSIKTSLITNKSTISPLVNQDDSVQIASIAGISTESANPEIENSPQPDQSKLPSIINFYTVIGILLLIIAGLIGYRAYKIRG